MVLVARLFRRVLVEKVVELIEDFWFFFEFCQDREFTQDQLTVKSISLANDDIFYVDPVLGAVGKRF